jgi:hypothetical protein
MAYIKKQCNSIAEKVADGQEPERKAPDDGDGGWLRPKEVGVFKHVDPSDTVSGHHFQSKLELIEELANSTPRKSNTCEHGRRKYVCKDCGTGYCQHGHQKHRCKDCGTGHCEHGRQRGRCKGC